jgi:hypothetical protein
VSEDPRERYGADDDAGAGPPVHQVAPPPWADATGPVPPPRAPETTAWGMPAGGGEMPPHGAPPAAGAEPGWGGDTAYPLQPYPPQPHPGQQWAPRPWEAQQQWEAQQWPGQPQWVPQPPPQQWGPPAQPWPQEAQQQWPPAPAPEQWAPSRPVPPVPPSSRPPVKGRNTGLVVGIVVAALVLAGGGGVGFWLWQKNSSDSGGTAVAGPPSSAAAASGSGSPVTVPSGETPTVAPTTAAPTTQSQEALEAQALAQLNALRVASLPRLPHDGRWVAQVASKSVGITDPLQTAQNGSHTFYAADILAESQAAQQKVDDPTKVYVIWGTDFGKRSQASNGLPYWMTVIDNGFAGSAAVKSWCASAYSSLTPQQLADTCVARQLTPSHD